jgi:alpha-L-fucosidase
VGSNHHVAPFPGEDFQMFEKGLPGQDPYNKGSGISALPLEMCQTIGHSWGYDQRDKSTKSLRELAQTLVRAAGYGANLLLNVGPMPDGTIQADHVARLKQLGEWLQGKEESIYGTRRGPVTPRSWGVTTVSRDGSKLYVHVLDLDTKAVALEATGGKPVAAHLLDGRPVEFAATKLGAIIRLPDERPDSLDTIVVLELK